ncbi:ZNF835 isoform 2, partial [Pan troglodytes]
MEGLLRVALQGAELEGNWKHEGQVEDLQENQESCPEPEAVACKGDPAGDSMQERDEFSRIPRTISSPAATQASVPDDSSSRRCSAPGESPKE